MYLLGKDNFKMSILNSQLSPIQKLWTSLQFPHLSRFHYGAHSKENIKHKGNI